MPGRTAVRIVPSRVATVLVTVPVQATTPWPPLARLENTRVPVAVIPELKPGKLELPRGTPTPLALRQQILALRCTPRVMSLLAK